MITHFNKSIMKKLINLSINSEYLCCSEKEENSPGKKTKRSLSGRAGFINEGSENGDYMSYKGHVEIQLNEAEMEEISKIATKSLARFAAEVEKSSPNKD